MKNIVFMNKQKYDVIVQGGQSNAEGCGKGPVTETFTPSASIFYLNVTKKVEIVGDNMSIKYPNEPLRIEPAKEREENGALIGDFSLTFAEEYENAGLLQEGRKLLIVRAAIGGTGFQKKQWGVESPLYRKMLEMTDYALSLNTENRIVAFLWHQGEHDAFGKNTPDRYKTQLGEQLRDFRSRYGADIPFITGEFVHDWLHKNEGICFPILEKCGSW